MIHNWRGHFMPENHDWWKRFGLVRRPHLTTHPLRPEDAGFFVQITDQPLNQLFSRLTDPRNLYGQVFAVLGDYGSGKTSLLNYIQAAIYSDDIFCVTIKDPPTSADKLDNWLYDRIFRRLTGSPKVASSDEVRKLVASPETILRVRDKLLAERKYDGFLIFIDELHHVLDPKVVCDFLKSKQGFFEDFVSGHSACFFVAGITQWLEYLKQPAYQGIFDYRVQMPYWVRAEDAYELVYRRFKAAASESGFVFPFSKYDSFEKILAIRKSESPKGTPRFIIENTLKLLESPKLHPDCRLITGEMVSKLVSVPKQEDIQAIEKILADDYAGICKALNSIARLPSDDREKLHTILLVLSQRPRGLNFVTSYRPNKLDHRLASGKIFKDLEDTLNSLDDLADLKLVRKKEFDLVELKGLPPDRYVDLLRSELRREPIIVRHYPLREDFLKFQDRIEEDFDMELQDYLSMLFIDSRVVMKQALPVPEDKITVLLNESEKYLKENESKRRLRVALMDHALLMERLENQTVDARSAIRAMRGFLKSLTQAFVIERTRSPDRMLGDLSEEIAEAFKELDLEEESLDLARTLIPQIEIFEERGEIDDESWGSLHERFKAVVFPYVNAFRRFAIEGPTMLAMKQLKRSQEELAREIREVMKKIEGAYVDSPHLRIEETRRFLEEISDRYALGAPSGGEWTLSLLETLQIGSADKPLHHSIQSRKHPQPNLTASSRKAALLYAGEVFENLLVILGRRHFDSEIRNYFNLAQKLQIGLMIIKTLGRIDKELVESVTKLGQFDRTGSIRSFEDKLKQISLECRSEIKDFSVAVQVRNFYSHDSQSWDSIVTTNYDQFTWAHDSMISAIIRLYVMFYMNEYFLPPVSFQKIELSEVSKEEKKAKVRVDNILWGWVDEFLVGKVWHWLEAGDQKWNEFEIPVSDIKMFDFLRAIGFLVKKGLVRLEGVHGSWICRLTEAGHEFKKTRRIPPLPLEKTQEWHEEPRLELQVEEATPLKLTPTAKKYLSTLFGILTSRDLEKSLQSNPTDFFTYRTPSRGEVHVFLNGDIMLETVSRSWARPGDMKIVNGFLVIGVRRREHFKTTDERISRYVKPMIVVP